MKISRQEFVDDAIQFCRALQSVSPAGDDNHDDSKALTKWKLVGNSDTRDAIYVTHPSVVCQVPDTVLIDCDEHDDTMTASELLQDDSILVDDDTISQPPLSQQQQCFEWRFSIVYSETWMVPVLYFTVKHCDTGMPLQRSQVLQLLNLHPNDQETWDFVSYDQHPITGEPSFFLHPCQTSERLSLLLRNVAECEGEEEAESQRNVSPLLSWASMILPATGFCMPIKTFVQVQSIIACTSNKDKD